MSTPDDEPLGRLMSRAMASMRPGLSRELQPLGLTWPAFMCLYTLADLPGGRSNAELARAIGVSPQALNTVLRALQATGAVTRPMSAPRGRALPAQQTSQGRLLIQRAQVAAKVVEDQLLRNLTPDQRCTIKQLLSRIALSHTALE